MKIPTRPLALLLALALAPALPAWGRAIAPELQAAIDSQGGQGEVPVIIGLAGKLDLRPFRQALKPDLHGPRDRRPLRELTRSLRDKADRDQAPLLGRLAGAGGHGVKKLWSINSIAARVPARLVAELDNDPAVASIRLDALVQAPVTTTAAASTAEWNIDAVHAPELWALGHTGTGVVVASMDTGVDYRHPDLASRWRGGTNSWYDPNGQHALPFDKLGHGTQTMGLMVGGNAGGTSIGVAPGAQWIAVKIFNDRGQASISNIHLGFQWLLDPDGDPNTDDAPDVVNHSWGLIDTVGLCEPEFQSDIQVLRTAGIAVAFAAGNDGPNANTSSSPANNPGAFPVGAVDSTLAVASFSSRGPSPCYPDPYPTLVAPGVSVKSSDLAPLSTATYAYATGTSFASPHVAGALALLIGAFPSATVAQLETALIDAAQGQPGGPDHNYGYGLVNVHAAYGLLAGPPANQAPIAVADAYGAVAGQILSVLASGVLGNDSDPDGNPITAQLDVTTSHGTLVLAGDGGFTYTPQAGYAGSDSFSYVAVDTGGLASPAATVSLTVYADGDGDGVADIQDNCSLVANANQRDSNNDGYGNLCDPDLNNNGLVNAADQAVLRSRLGTADPDADLNGNGIVNAADLAILRSYLGKPPGPSGLMP